MVLGPRQADPRPPSSGETSQITPWLWSSNLGQNRTQLVSNALFLTRSQPECAIYLHKRVSNLKAHCLALSSPCDTIIIVKSIVKLGPASFERYLQEALVRGLRVPKHFLFRNKPKCSSFLHNTALVAPYVGLST